MQLEFEFLNGFRDVGIFDPAQRRVQVTPDESLMGETKPPFLHADCRFPEPYHCIFPQPLTVSGVGQECRRCKRGTIVKIEYQNSKEGPSVAYRCNYCLR